MPKVRMSLAEAGAALGIAPNGVRSRYKAGKLAGERDNSGRIWVWLDLSDSNPSKNSIEPRLEGKSATSEPDRSQLLKAETRVAVLEAELEGERRLSAELRQDRDAWRDQAQRLAAAPAERGRWWPFRR